VSILKKLVPILFVLTAFICISCDKASNSPRGCVSSFIIAIEQHDMSRAWDLLGKDAQSYFNSLGERQRRSGKGAFENEIDKIKTFRNAKKDYAIHEDKGVQDTIKLRVLGGREFNVNIIDEDGDYKIKDETSVKHILDVITGELKPKEDFY
jgi:hypothetical protein